MNKTTRTALNIALSIVILFSSNVARPSSLSSTNHVNVTTHEGI